MVDPLRYGPLPRLSVPEVPTQMTIEEAMAAMFCVGFCCGVALCWYAMMGLVG